MRVPIAGVVVLFLALQSAYTTTLPVWTQLNIKADMSHRPFSFRVALKQQHLDVLE